MPAVGHPESAVAPALERGNWTGGLKENLREVTSATDAGVGLALAALVSGERNAKQLSKEAPAPEVRWEFVVNRCKENLDWLETLICHIPNHVGRVDIFVFDKCGSGPLDQIEQT